MIQLAEYLGEGIVAFAVLLIIPAIIVVLTLEPAEGKHRYSVLLENHFLDKLINR